MAEFNVINLEFIYKKNKIYYYVSFFDLCNN